MKTTIDEAGRLVIPPTTDVSSFPLSDGKPVAETLANMVQMYDLMYSLHRLLAAQGRTRIAIGGNQFLYYNEHNQRDNLSPDTYVALDVAPAPRNVWFTWIEGKCPDVVFEITSPSTEKNDLSMRPRGKLRLYAELGAREYFVYDPQLVMQPILKGFALRDDGFEPLPMLPNGGIVSPLLRAELRPMAMPQGEQRPAGTYLRVFDAVTGQLYPVYDEHVAREEGRAILAEGRVALEEQARRAAEEQMVQAQERVARAETELRELRAALARQQEHQA